MTVTITSATPHVVTWRAGNSLHIESTRDAVEAWIDDADLMGHVDVDGLHLSPGDLANMRAAMDDAHDVRQEQLRDRAADFGSNWSA